VARTAASMPTTAGITTYPTEAAVAVQQRQTLTWLKKGGPHEAKPSSRYYVEMGDLGVQVGTATALREREDLFCKINSSQSCTKLPHEALDWGNRECELWFRTQGAFHPRKSLRGLRRQQSNTSTDPSQNGMQDLISVVTPTTESRRHFHECLWTCFEVQSWPHKQLVVVETYQNKPSRFFTQLSKHDPRVIYIGFKRPLTTRNVIAGKMKPCFDFSIGLKRNIGIHLASGAIIAHFDDDDLYAPSYLSYMASKQHEADAVAITLSSWAVLNLETGSFGLCDPVALGQQHGLKAKDDLIKEQVYGFGFSYLYKKEVALESPFPDINMGEDYSFYSSILKTRGEHAIALCDDHDGICLHTQHNLSTSTSAVLKQLKSEEVHYRCQFAQCPAFNDWMRVTALLTSVAGLLEEKWPDASASLVVHLTDLLLGTHPEIPLERIAFELRISVQELTDEISKFADMHLLHTMQG